MKRIFLLVIFASAVSVSWGQYKSNIIGIRGGMNATSLSSSSSQGFPSGVQRPAKFGWHVGVSDQILLGSGLPFYLETGLFFSNKGGRWLYTETVEGVNYRTSETLGMTYLQIPVKINYHFHLEDITIEPFFGVHYAFGLWGRSVSEESVGGNSSREVEKLYRSSDNLSRSDAGISLGVGGTWSNYYAAFSWERGFLDLDKDAGHKMRNTSNFMITVGYNF